MMMMLLRNTFVLQALLLTVCAIENPEPKNDNDSSTECGLYLAISSTSTLQSTNWGLYAGKDIPNQSTIGSTDVGIHLPDIRANSYIAEHDDDDEEESHQATLTSIVQFFESFFWVADTIGARFEVTTPPGKMSIAAVPGAGVLAAYNAKRTNANWNITAVYHRPSSNTETKPGISHPNRGAISPFYNIQVISTTNIPAGSEIFLEFGEAWKEQEENADDLTKEDYERIDETVTQMIAFFEKHKEALDVDSKNEIYSFLIKDVMKAALGTEKARRVTSILPPKPEELHKVVDGGGSLAYSDPSAQRSVEWLQTYGLCVDNIRAGTSTIPNAGRGAFATRFIPQDGLVAPVPVTHIVDKSVLDMHDLEVSEEDGERVRASDQVITQQLMLNYCYGHPQSTMVFFPVGPVAALINHSDEPNAKLVWSKHPNHQKLWLTLEPEELLDEEHQNLGLLLEIVALRDIQPGEEIFIDYGPEWKSAYQKHVEEWNRKLQAGEIPKEWPLRAVDLNEQYRNQPFPQSYPENVALKAFLLLLDTPNKGAIDDPKQWGETETEKAYKHQNLFDIVIIKHETVEGGSFNYTVRLDDGKTHVKGIPHDALVFVDRPGTSDQFTPFSFRHYIGIPDDVFPKGPWRNLVEE